MTLEEIERCDKEVLVPKDIAPILGCCAYNINIQAQEDAKNGTNSFPFPVIVIRSRVKIPRRAFLEVMKHGRTDEEGTHGD